MVLKCLREVSRQELGHGEAAQPLAPEHLGHLLVRDEELLVLRVLEVVLLDVGPQLLDALGPGSLLLPDDFRQVGRQLHGLGEAGSLARHVVVVVGLLKVVDGANGADGADVVAA